MKRPCSVSTTPTLYSDEFYFKRYLDDGCVNNEVTPDIGKPLASEERRGRRLIRISNTVGKAVANTEFDKDNEWAKILSIATISPSPIPRLHVPSTQYAIIRDVS